MAFALLKLDPEFFRRLLLESFKRTGKRPDFVTAIPIFGVDGQIAGGDLQHGVAHVMQRFDDPAGNGEYGPGRQGNGRSEQGKLQHHPHQSLRMLERNVVLGGIECRLSDSDSAGETCNRERAPLSCPHFGLGAVDQRGQQAIPQTTIRRVEICRLGRGHGIGKRCRQLHSGCRQFERAPCGLHATDVFGVDQASVRLYPADGEPVRDHHRCFAGRIAQQPGDLFYGQQLVDRGVLMIDYRDERGRELLQQRKQCGRRFRVFLDQRRPARRLGLVQLLPEFLMLRRQLLEQALQLGHERRLLRKFDSGQQLKGMAHRRHLICPDSA